MDRPFLGGPFPPASSEEDVDMLLEELAKGANTAPAADRAKYAMIHEICRFDFKS